MTDAERIAALERQVEQLQKAIRPLLAIRTKDGVEATYAEGSVTLPVVSTPETNPSSPLT